MNASESSTAALGNDPGMHSVEYTIRSEPVSVDFECPHCECSVDLPYDGFDDKLCLWLSDGVTAACPECGCGVRLAYCIGS